MLNLFYTFEIQYKIQFKIQALSLYYLTAYHRDKQKSVAYNNFNLEC